LWQGSWHCDADEDGYSGWRDPEWQQPQINLIGRGELPNMTPNCSS
jgi:hypothetical protein